MPTHLRTCAEVNFLGLIHHEQWADVPCMERSAVRFGIVQRGSHQTEQLSGFIASDACLWAALLLLSGCTPHVCSPCGTLTK